MLPVGSIIPVLPVHNAQGVPLFVDPESGKWALCDGSVIVDADSPLNGHKLPNLVGLRLVPSSNAGQTQQGAAVQSTFSEDCFEGFSQYCAKESVVVSLDNSPELFVKFFMRIK